ncbi:hypothetical protein H9Q70_006076 [Fusarium xylarioides]|nr:hypothetical protein H9Q70_006076 [Fusarium xylarioides]KAG5779846.1 hypothetical protein H9Q73_006495 [Fusarium xylarioides]
MIWPEDEGILERLQDASGIAEWNVADEPAAGKPKKILETIARMVPSKQIEDHFPYPPIAHRFLQLQSQVKNGEIGEVQEEELAKLMACTLFSRSDDGATQDEKFSQAMKEAALRCRPEIKGLVQDKAILH